MKKSIQNQILPLDKGKTPDNSEYSELLKKIDFKIDDDFLDFISTYNGAEGIMGKHNFIQFWNISQLIGMNPYYEGIKICDELFFFGSDGSNLGYAFDKLGGQIVSIDFLDLADNQPEIIAETFDLFLSELSNG